MHSIIYLYNRLTNTEQADPDIELLNFIHGLRYIDNLQYIDKLIKEINSIKYIGELDVLPSYKSHYVYKNADEYETSFRHINLSTTARVDDYDKILGLLQKDKIVTRLTDSVTINNGKIELLMKDCG